MFPDRVFMDVSNVLGVVSSVPNPVILKSFLPDLHIRAQFFLCPEGEASLKELDCLFKAAEWRYQDMDVIVHDDKFVEKVGRASIMVEGVDEQLCPSFGVEKRTSAPGLGRDHVSLAVVGRRFSLGSHVLALGG